jgi:thiamine-phosphate pyrophosphorylase
VIPRFYPIVDTAATALHDGEVTEVAKALLDAGVRMLQYRHKENWTQQHYDEAASIAELGRSAGAAFVVNDRADYAHLLEAGVHLGQDDLPPVAARKIMGNVALMGFSTHNRRQLLLGAEEPVQYLAIGPIFPTTSKLKPDPALGLDRLKTFRALTDKPLVAIGGIRLDNAASVFEAGVDAVATISGFLIDGSEAGKVTASAKRWLSL